jgi:hypothetical protein
MGHVAGAPATLTFAWQEQRCERDVRGVEWSDRSPKPMAGGDLLFLSHGYLGALVRRRAKRGKGERPLAAL